MCGRYGTDGNVNDWLRHHCRVIGDDVLRPGDIRPGENAPVVIAGSPRPLVVPMTWGIAGKGGRVINARKETIWEKPLFRHAVRFRRCLIPARCFYEWDRGKQKVSFRGEDADILFLAGIFREEAGNGRFVILTAPADESVRAVHDRMPVRIPEPLMGKWLSDGTRTREILAELAHEQFKRAQAA